jgi:formate dehydrogenase
MVLLTRSLCRLAARPALSSSLFTSAARSSPSTLSRGALALRHNYSNLGSIRTLTGVREKVKVLLVLYDGKKHAEEVSLQLTRLIKSGMM